MIICNLSLLVNPAPFLNRSQKIGDLFYYIVVLISFILFNSFYFSYKFEFRKPNSEKVRDQCCGCYFSFMTVISILAVFWGARVTQNGENVMVAL